MQEATARLQAAVGLPTAETYIFDDGRLSAQRWLSDVAPVDFSQLSENDVATIQKHHVLDWLISNHDAHPDQFLRTPQGDIVGIDKDQAFRYFGRDKLDPTFHPNSFYGQEEPVYNSLWREFSVGRQRLVDPRTGELGDFIHRLGRIPDDDLRQLLRPYAEQAARAGKLLDTDDGQPDLGEPRIGPNDVDSFLSAAVERKNNLFNDFGSLYDGLSRPSAQLDSAIGPTNIAGVYTPRNPSGMIFVRSDNDPLYRYDHRPPDVIFRDGFAPQQSDPRFVTAQSFVSTTRDPLVNVLDTPQSKGQRVYRYTIDAPGGVDVNKTEGLSRSAYQQEVAFPGGIRRENIRDAVEILPPPTGHDGTAPDAATAFGPTQVNSIFNPNMPNAAPRFPVGALDGGDDDSLAESAIVFGSGRVHPMGGGAPRPPNLSELQFAAPGDSVTRASRVRRCRRY